MTRLKIINRCRSSREGERALLRIAKKAARSVSVPQDEVSIVLVSAAEMKMFNKRFTGRLSDTDVLSFDVSAQVPRVKRYGDVIISLGAAARNAPRFKSDYALEVARYAIHGLLHLAGHDDSAARERALMRREEERVLAQVCTEKELSKVSTLR